MGSNLYVDFDGLERNIQELKDWKTSFDELNNRVKLKVEEMNSVWRGSDYDSMRNTITRELNKISGPDGMIQSFINESISDLNAKLGRYENIQKNNASYWENV